MARARFVGLLFLWALRASSEATYGTGRHPICGVLEGNDHRHRYNELPTHYTCGSGEGTITCSSSPTFVLEPALERHSSGSTLDEQRPAATGGLVGHPPAVSSSVVSGARGTWLVCEGIRDRESRGAVEDRSWIDCEGYFAYAGSVDNPSQFCPGFRKNSHQGDNFKVAHARTLASSLETTDDEFELEGDVSGEHAAEQDPTSNDSKFHIASRKKERPVDVTTHLAMDDNGSMGGMEGDDRFVHTRNDEECDGVWASWPVVQEAALAKTQILMLDLFPAVGNMFIVLGNLIKVARLLEVAIVLNCKGFEGFRVAFDPAGIMWDVHPARVLRKLNQIAQVGSERSGLHSFKFLDGVMILDDSQLELLGREMGIPSKWADEIAESVRHSYPTRMRKLLLHLARTQPPVPPCAWNMLLRRSPSMMRSLAANSPWADHDSRPKDYVAWHIRTSDGENAGSFKPDVHTYIFDGQSSTDVCPRYLAATVAVENACQDLFPGGVQAMPIFISSNSKSMSRNCTSDVADGELRAGFIDLGIADSDAHTNFSKDPELSAVSAFTDYLFLMDAAMIVRTRSSFSGTVAVIRNLKCPLAPAGEAQAINGLRMCMPRAC
ncbi:unnamed protein product [Scytosiphon promiscuus]